MSVYGAKIIPNQAFILIFIEKSNLLPGSSKLLFVLTYQYRHAQCNKIQSYCAACQLTHLIYNPHTHKLQGSFCKRGWKNCECQRNKMFSVRSYLLEISEVTPIESNVTIYIYTYVCVYSFACINNNKVSGVYELWV